MSTGISRPPIVVPYDVTAMNGPIKLNSHILDAQSAIEHWFCTKWQDHAAPFYSSVDLRNSGFKLAPIDTNLFPGGFNNLNPDFLHLCVQATQNAIEKICPDARGVLLVPECHTRNQFYLQNVAQLSVILEQAGLDVRLGSLLPEITTPTTLQLSYGSRLTLEPLQRRGNRLGVGDFDSCVVLLNNDLSAGVPDILKNLEQTVLPPLKAGWTMRRKSQHFAAYNKAAAELAQLINIDPWLINAYFAHCGGIDFHQHIGEECLAASVDEILQKIRVKYAEYGLNKKPFVMVKADAGTYGMGIMAVKDASEVRNLSHHQRNKMAVVKEGLKVHDVLVQEGVYSFESINEAVAEPVVYMMDRYVVGGFYRAHTGRGADENLNAPGMHFVPLDFESCCTLTNPERMPDDVPNWFYAYGVVARLALLAAAIELEEMQK
jgi:glutamate--cysteine ligase